MLITAETLVKQSSEGLPGDVLNVALNILEPTCSCVSEVVGGYMNPDGCVNRVHLEVVHGSSDPQLRIISIKLGKSILGRWPRWGLALGFWGCCWWGSGGITICGGGLGGGGWGTGWLI